MFVLASRKKHHGTLALLDNLVEWLIIVDKSQVDSAYTFRRLL